jgi:hypothetical protein
MARGRKPTTGGRAMTAAERQRRRRALKQFSETRRYAEDLRREKPFSITWNNKNLIGRITIDGEYWAAVEWSNKHHCWCIEDSTGACLAHQEAIQGAAASKDAAVALATEMIRDGRMPSPQEAREEAKQRRWARLSEEERTLEEARAADWERLRLAREKRAQQPAEQRRRAEARQRAEEHTKLLHARYANDWQENQAPPLDEVLADVFDFADPELWKSNSFSALRPRLVVHVSARVAKLEYELACTIDRAGKQPFSMSASKERQQQQREQRQSWGKKECLRIQQNLDRAREILDLLRAGR